MSERPTSGLTLCAFGGLSIALDGQTLDDRIPLKARALLLYVCRQGQPQPREKLASLFWSDFAADRSAHNQRMALMPVREYLAEHVDISRTEINVRAWVDVNNFERVLNNLRPILNGDQPFTSPEIEALAQTLALCRSDFLANVRLSDASTFDEWVTIEREALRQRFINAASRLIDFYVETMRYVDGIDLSLRLLTTDPLHEETHRRLMTLYAVSGDRTSSLQQFERCQKILWDELGVEPDDETIKLYEKVAAGEIDTIPTAISVIASPRQIPTNLPGDLSIFIGRTDEIQQVVELITTVRCVSLIGAGGIGKTRLSLQAAHQALECFPDGVFWVELAPLLNATSVPDAICHALNLLNNGSLSVRDLLTAFLREKHLLLVLDNFEHVLDAADFIYDLLQAAPNLRVLTTSREALQLYGEYIYNVPVMPIDDASALFLDRARAVNPSFQVDDSSPIEELCARLDHLPLAIELAASQARRQTLKGILSHLELSRLATNLRGVSERQRTLFNTIEWSYDLLTPDEQTLYRRLAHFVGSWTSEAAFAVCGMVAQYLDVLVERSLLRRETEGEAVRYSMLQIIREHARLKLAVHNEEQLVLDNYIAYYVELAERGNIGLHGWEFVRWFNVLEDNLSNFHAAIEHAVVQEEIESEARLISALGIFWHNATYPREARIFAERALRHRDFLPAELLAGVLTALGHAIHVGADYDVSTKYYQEARTLYRLCGDRWNEALLVLCETTNRPNVQSSLELIQQTRDMIQDLNEVFLFANLSTHISMAYTCLNDPHNAERAAREGLERTSGSPGDVTQSLRHALGIALREQGRLEEALTIFREYDASGKEAHRYYLGNMLFDECQTLLLLDRIAEAEDCFQRGVALERYQVSIEFIRRLNILGAIAAYSAGHLHESCRRYRIALQFADGALNELFGLNTFAIALVALVWQMAAEGYLTEASHLRDLLLKVLADRAIPLGYVQSFYLNRAAPILIGYPSTKIEPLDPHTLFTYASECIARLEQ
jgi:predicted ATPase/DNA-binding SARP family transcriptional activator